MTDQNAITATQRPIFAISEDDKRAARALKMMLPYGKLLTEDNALALLVYGRAHGLDPLNQECYFLVREKKDRNTGEVTGREELGCYTGIKGVRKQSRRQLAGSDHTATYKISYDVMSSESMAKLGVDPAEVACGIRAELRDDVSMGRYIVDTLNLAKAGYSKDEINTILGKPPIVVGYGIVKRDEARWMKVEPIKQARKRSEADALKQRFDLPDQVADDIPQELTAGDSDIPEQLTAGNAQEIEDGEFEKQPESKQPFTKEREKEIMGQLGF